MGQTGVATSSVRRAAGADVAVTGKLDFLTAPLLEAELSRIEASVRLIRLDLTLVSFFDACGVQAVLSAYERAREANRGFAILHGPTPMIRGLERLGYAYLLEAEAVPDRSSSGFFRAAPPSTIERIHGPSGGEPCAKPT